MLRVLVDFECCKNYATCVTIAPEVFDLSDDGELMLLQETPPEEFEKRLRDAARLCPTQAITLLEE